MGYDLESPFEEISRGLKLSEKTKVMLTINRRAFSSVMVHNKYCLIVPDGARASE
jgi:hypothetical protein